MTKTSLGFSEIFLIFSNFFVLFLLVSSKIDPLMIILVYCVETIILEIFTYLKVLIIFYEDSIDKSRRYISELILASFIGIPLSALILFGMSIIQIIIIDKYVFDPLPPDWLALIAPNILILSLNHISSTIKFLKKKEYLASLYKPLLEQTKEDGKKHPSIIAGLGLRLFLTHMLIVMSIVATVAFHLSADYVFACALVFVKIMVDFIGYRIEQRTGEQPTPMINN